MLFLCAIDPCYYPEAIINMSVRHTTAVGDMFLHSEEYGHGGLFRNVSKD